MLLLLVSGSLLTACGDDEKNEPLPIPSDVIIPEIKIVDAEGNNLLDPNVPGNWYGAEMWAEYNGQIEMALWADYGDQALQKNSRSYTPTYAGLYEYTECEYIKGDSASGVTVIPDFSTTVLRFGHFTGERDLDIDVLFTIPELDKTYHIQIYNKVIDINKKEVTRWVKCDGELCDGTIITLVLPHREE
ncbi:MAG: hypothetical protein K2M79_02625 [Muribaculaceae bacterium]|nr:hypothetical protein [Muribaculaceae bacterium]